MEYYNPVFDFARASGGSVNYLLIAQCISNYKIQYDYSKETGFSMLPNETHSIFSLVPNINFDMYYSDSFEEFIILRREILNLLEFYSNEKTTYDYLFEENDSCLTVILFFNNDELCTDDFINYLNSYLLDGAVFSVYEKEVMLEFDQDASFFACLSSLNLSFQHLLKDINKVEVDDTLRKSCRF